MTSFVLAVLAVLSVWDYPLRFREHERLRTQFVAAVREGDTETMVETCRKGVKLLPDDPTWQYNLACSLAYFKDQEPAFEALEKAIDLGFRDAEAIANDTDLKRLAGKARFKELVEYAREMASKPVRVGPLVTVPATGIFGEPLVLGEQNLVWDFDAGCFDAKVKLAAASSGGNVGDLYMNRDGGHSQLGEKEFPGLTEVRFDDTGRDRKLDLNAPNVFFPYPTFGNSSRAYVSGSFWRSLPRSLVTVEASRLKSLLKMYLSNQVWVFPSVADTAPVGTNGDVFASVTPYWLVAAGGSRSDLPYLRAALTASKSFQPAVKKAIVARGLLAPTIQTLLRKSLKTVKTEADYLSAKAHPTALPADGVDLGRLVSAAEKLQVGEIPPLAVLSVSTPQVRAKSPWPELTYATAFAWAYVLRADDEVREFVIEAKGAEEFAFVRTHGSGVDVKIERPRPDAAKVTVSRRGMGPTNRVDIAVFGRNAGTGWGAPSYVSIARMDSAAPYSDPALTTLDEPKQQ